MKIELHPSIIDGLFVIQKSDQIDYFDLQVCNKFANQIELKIPLDLEQQTSILRILKKYRKTLKKEGISLPTWKEFDSFIKQQESFHLVPVGVQEYQIINLLKKTSYIVTIMGDVLSCDCPAFAAKGSCKHCDFTATTLNQNNFNKNNKNDENDENDENKKEETTVQIGNWFLNSDQAKALKSLINWINSDKQFYLLMGSAGTGKSFILQAFLKQLRDLGKTQSDYPVVFTAPTNKAVKVLATMAMQWKLDVDTVTCHKLLGLKPVKRNNQLEFEPNSEESVGKNIQYYRLIVVDEVSMLPELLWTFLSSACNPNQKILFVGDPDQAPPINENFSKAFEIQNFSKLTQIERYSGAIGKVAETLRKTIYEELPSVPVFESIEDTIAPVIVQSQTMWEINLVRQFNSPEYKADQNYVRAIAYSNRRVESLNLKIREKLYGIDAPEYLEGERIITQEAYDGISFVIPTSEEGIIVSAQECMIGRWQSWSLQIRFDNGVLATIPVIARNDKAQFEQYLKDLIAEKQWQKYWAQKEQFADIRYPFALTAHKAQGSTFNNVFVDLKNFVTTYNWITKGLSKEDRKKKLKERSQLLYTAITRAAKRLYLLQ